MAKELITKIDDYIHHTNDLTREMDSYLVTGDKYIEYSQTYVYDSKFEMNDGNFSYPIRHPGATRGGIRIDRDNIILDIELYDDEYHTDKIYKPEVRDIFKKYIGMKLVMIEEGKRHGKNVRNR